MGGTRRILIGCAIIFGVGIVLALVGPFGSFEAPFGLRLLYWLAMSYAGYFLYFPAMVAARALAPRLDLPEPALWAAACLIVTLPMAAVTWIANFLWHPPRWPTLEEALSHYFNVLVLGALVCALFWFAQARRADPVEPEAEPIGTAPPRLLERLPAHLRSAPIALEMEDHYVRVHTAQGSALLLMRMRDAVAELDNMPGALVHRSWWVAQGAVQGVRRDGRNVRLQLTGGIEAPVARTQVSALEAAGWL
ncbi:LytTR family transcriptional regulator DNA-binding domain-containing protein [Sphingomonas sp. R-74633]|uniref:LytTR family DNA-binding domain-containing protein n=1 Tax=Sphingomonas sp. R-74633 TaxID=2751188 RepID=UPI0015D1F15E|nr:LytTR family DNA-binding domain-containing protein [Sphingomonas sp. R-74633]NYT42434.1 LytTR family transcriptional regulator DNA-binding domain-containing protein [Sphingomonas sp. R-74633]